MIPPITAGLSGGDRPGPLTADTVGGPFHPVLRVAARQFYEEER